MKLEKYREKRKFNHTKEPQGRRRKNVKGHLIFVIHKHAATNLHYDLRLEMEKVLKSWAIPKGPSLNPEERRLAIMVEDHPFDYKEFEGIIPEGNYGAGEVIIWDEGTYYVKKGLTKSQNEKLLIKGLDKGHISFYLEGKKLTGQFSLIRIPSRGENAWMLVKKKDIQ
ncbi:MAG: hypothetical protein M3Q58_13270, partial [Bacteroidota bacterium]|nr:hypothetical protein [Bacteroidota bacterium]